MTRYELYREIACILSPKHSDELFDYIIHAMDDDGGFLRTRWCYWDTALPDRGLGDIKTVLVTLRSPFDLENDTGYYTHEDGYEEKLTKLKMQLFYSDMSDEGVFIDNMEWSAQVSYCYPLKIDLERRSFELLPRCEIYC